MAVSSSVVLLPSMADAANILGSSMIVWSKRGNRRKKDREMRKGSIQKIYIYKNQK